MRVLILCCIGCVARCLGFVLMFVLMLRCTLYLGLWGLLMFGGVDILPYAFEFDVVGYISLLLLVCI